MLARPPQALRVVAGMGEGVVAQQQVERLPTPGAELLAHDQAVQRALVPGRATVPLDLPAQIALGQIQDAHPQARQVGQAGQQPVQRAPACVQRAHRCRLQQRVQPCRQSLGVLVTLGAGGQPVDVRSRLGQQRHPLQQGLGRKVTQAAEFERQAQARAATRGVFQVHPGDRPQPGHQGVDGVQAHVMEAALLHRRQFVAGAAREIAQHPQHAGLPAHPGCPVPAGDVSQVLRRHRPPPVRRPMRRNAPARRHRQPPPAHHWPPPRNSARATRW